MTRLCAAIDEEMQLVLTRQEIKQRPIMNTKELTQIVTAHQTAIARHEQWQAEQESASRRHDIEMSEVRATLATIASQQALNTQEINRLTAGMIDLRDQVSNFVRSQEQPGTPKAQ